MDELMFKTGQMLGPYRIVRCIGRGGMAEVYEVEHEGIGVRYALKAFVYRGGELWPMLRAKFMEEGQVLARLKHPNLVRVFDLTIDGETGTAYYVMDLVLYKDGEPYTLDDVDRKSVSEDIAFFWFRDLCNALDYVHAQGVVHRDVKLNNVLLNADKHAILSDFGIAHIFGDGMVKAPAGACVTEAFAPSGERPVLGTESYIAPEVAAGGAATPASDTYALGVVMFKLLTGVWYEPGMDARALLAGRKWKYRWADVLPDMLETEPAARPQILAQTVIGLLPRERPAPTKENAKRRKRRNRWIWIATALACAMLVVGGGVCAWLLTRSAQESERREELERRQRENESRLRREVLEAKRKAEEEALARQKATEKAMEETQNARRKAEEAAANIIKAKAAVEPPAPTRNEEDKPAVVQQKLEAPVKTIPAKTYRWRDGSGEPQEVSFEVADGCAVRLVPLRTEDEAFWMSRLPVTVAAWRAVNGGLDELKPLEDALPEEYSLGVLMDESEAEAFCRAMTERFGASLPESCEVRLATESEMIAALAEDETAKLCEATGRSVDDCVGTSGAVARTRFRRVKSECRLERFGEWTDDGRLVGKSIAAAGLSMPRASGIIGLCKGASKSTLWHFVVAPSRR